VAVEKLDIHKNSMIFGDGKWSDAPHKSFMGHPDTTLFWTLSPHLTFFNSHRTTHSSSLAGFQQEVSLPK
jgi:hypothetical protein